MSQRIVIDSLAYALETGSLQGELPIASLTRVLDLLVDSTGVLSYRVDGKMGPRKRPQLVLAVDGVLALCCQRCLERIDYPVKLRSVLEFVTDEEDLTQEELEDDAKDYLPAQEVVDVAALIEDEVILDLPPAPRHERCALPSAAREAEVLSPFSVLKDLKGKAR